MTKARLLASLCLVLLLGSAPLLAQPEADETKDAKPAAAQAKKTAPATGKPATTPQPQKNTPPAQRKDSPFDYRSSEEISEDVPVSFPVDI